MRLSLVLVLLAWPVSLFARLGDSESELVRRYGAPTSREKDPSAEKTLTFEKPGLLIVAQLRQGKCVSLTVTRIGEQIEAKELQQILSENAQSQKWSHDDKSPEIWRRGDGTVAYANPGFVTVVTPEQEKQSSGLDPSQGASPTAPGTPLAPQPAKK